LILIQRRRRGRRRDETYF
jgi:hypothetical protein